MADPYKGKMTRRQKAAHTESIAVSKLVKRLQSHALGVTYRDDETGELVAQDGVMLPSQLRAAEVLLRKSLPDLQSTELDTGDGGLVVNLVSQVADGNKPTDT